MLEREQIIPKIKKYLLFISVVFFLSLFSHLLFLYLYKDAKITPLKGGNISEAIIGDFPHLNPLLSSQDHNKYIISALYRSLLRYDAKEKRFVGDLANCDIKNLQSVECFLNEEIKWSDNSSLTSQDIVATFDLIKMTDSNPIISKLLDEVTLEDKGTSLIFRTKKSDINFLTIFLQPIIAKKTIDSLKESDIVGKFPVEGMLYSGPYQVEGVLEDENLGIKKLVLAKNLSFSSNEFVIEKIIFKVFRDTAQFLSQKDSINIFNDKESLIGDTLPRLSVYEYTLPQYVSLFLNIDTIKDGSLRSLIIESIKRENILKLLGEKNFLSVNNPYLLSGSIEIFGKEKNSESILRKNGYFRKEELLKLSANLKKSSSPVQNLSTSQQIEAIDLSKKTKIIRGPSDLYYNFIIKDDFLLQGDVEDTVEAVYINDYKLKGYKIGDTKFTYRLKKETLGTIQEGKNLYQIYFEKKGKKTKVDEVVFFYYLDEKTLNAEKEKLMNPSASNSLSTGSLVTQFSSEEDVSYLQQIEKLDAKYVYDKDFKPLKLILWYPTNDLHLETTAKSIQAQLSDIGIVLETKGLDISQINQFLLSGKKEYDIVLIGLNLGYFENNIFPYFHSSQVDKGYNFSNYKKLGLDIILEDLKTLSLSPDKSRELQIKALEMISQESIVKTLYTPIMKQLVDKNIKNYNLPSFLNDETLRFYGLKYAYTAEKKMIQVGEKSFFGFFYFLWEHLLR